MTRIELAPEVFYDFDRFFEYIAQFDARHLHPSALATCWKPSKS